MIKDSDLFAIGLDTDGVIGFRAQMALRSYKRRAIWPEHFRGPRVDNFERGAMVARSFIARRMGWGLALRKARREDFRTEGYTRNFVSEGAERRAEQLETLMDVAKELIGR